MSAVLPKDLAFLAPLPGLPALTHFYLQPIDGADGLFALQASEPASEPAVSGPAAPERVVVSGRVAQRLFVLDAAVYVPDYEPIISSADAAALGLSDVADALVLVVANPGENGTSVNLLAPIVANRRTGACSQVILEGQDWPLHAKLTARSA